MTQKDAMKKMIMQRVYIICTVRKLFSATALKLYVLVGASVAVSSFVSVTNVFRNMPALGDFYALYNFSTQAVMYTETTVKLLLMVAVVAFVFLLRDLVRSRLSIPVEAWS